MRAYRLGLPAAATVLAIAGLAAPASAGEDSDEPLVGVLVPEQVTVIEGHTKTVTATVVNAGTAEAKAVVLQFGSTLHPVDASVGLHLPAGCDARGCAVGDLAPGAGKKYTFSLTPADDLTSTFDVTVGGAEGVLGYESPVTVVRAKGGVDLELASIDDMKLDRRQAADVPVLVRNAGTDQVDGIALAMVAESGLEAFTKYRNCEAETDADLSTVVCVFDQKLPAGATFTLPSDTPLRIRVAPDAGGPYKYSVGVAAVGITDKSGLSAAAGGPTLKLESVKSTKSEDDLNEDDNIVSFGVQVGRSSADSSAIGGTFTGAIGDTATVQVGVHNFGPTAVLPPSLTWFQTVQVTIPSGIHLTAADDDCVPGTETGDVNFEQAGTVGGNIYTCFVLTRLPRNASHQFTFTGEITARTKPGKVLVDGGIQDPTTKNNTADLAVKLTSGGAGAGLPVTGAPSAWLAAAGTLLLIIGTAAFRLARRRRIVTLPE